MRRIFLSIGLCSLAFADNSLNRDLPGKIDLSLPGQIGAIPYEIPKDFEVSADIAPKIADTFYNHDRAVAEKLFSHEHFAYLPPGTFIQKNGASWSYPVGTLLIHRISYLYFDQKKIFEVRIMKKLWTGQWAFGLYIPTDGSLTLLTSETRDAEINLASSVLRVRRINPESCQSCHFGHSSVEYPPGPTRDIFTIFAGPCGFTPANKSLTEGENSWAAQFAEIYGYWPIQ